MQLYRIDTKSNELPCGPINLDEALQALHDATKQTTLQYECEEDCLDQTTFDLSRDQEDWLKVNCIQPGFIQFLSDRICIPKPTPKGFLAWIFSSRDNDFNFRGNYRFAEKVIRDYFELPRLEFEEKYREGLSDRDVELQINGRGEIERL